MTPLVLASGSPRRRDLLARLGLPFVAVASEVDEAVVGRLPPPGLVAELAERKARAVAAGLSRGLVLGADTAVVLGEAVLGKPRDGDDAERTLRLLRGRAHEVWTGVALLDAATGELERSAVRSAVRMRAYWDDEIRAYVATGEPLDKAGAYGVQGLGGTLVESVEGCFTNVVGLPLCEVERMLGRSGEAEPSERAVCARPDGTACPRLAQIP